MTQTPKDRFETVARAKHDALVEIYDALQAAAPDPGDKALYQRQSASKALLTHIALLRKLLGLAPLPGATAAGNDTLDIAGYRAMVADLDAVALDEAADG
jgi:hypothetical protein